MRTTCSSFCLWKSKLSSVALPSYLQQNERANIKTVHLITRMACLLICFSGLNNNNYNEYILLGQADISAHMCYNNVMEFVVNKPINRFVFQKFWFK